MNIFTITQGNKITYAIMKSEKGLRRAHRKGKCNMFCDICEEEALKYAKEHGINWK